MQRTRKVNTILCLPLESTEAGGEGGETVPSEIEHLKELQFTDVVRETGQQQILGVQFLQPLNE